MNLALPRLSLSALAVLMLCAAVAGGRAVAQEQPAAEAQASAAQDLPVCRLDPHDSNKLAVEPCRPAPPVGTRRAVAQVIGRMPATQMAPPVVHFQTMPPGSSAAVSRPLVPAGACDVGGCRDAAGARYNGAGNSTLDANGHICQRNGAFIQCF
ncbi:hypothetical protein [Janthinobacterium sp.]|uniref:hypothetical protein n=1 Tax=Janthinobacterium sp. TaxID=1871054 RepID=UPI00262E50A3|nr:hypothetical protein [Janthinobacterium sp.]